MVELFNVLFQDIPVQQTLIYLTPHLYCLANMLCFCGILSYFIFLIFSLSRKVETLPPLSPPLSPTIIVVEILNPKQLKTRKKEEKREILPLHWKNTKTDPAKMQRKKMVSGVYLFIFFFMISEKCAAFC